MTMPLEYQALIQARTDTVKKADEVLTALRDKQAALVESPDDEEIASSVEKLKAQDDGLDTRIKSLDEDIDREERNRERLRARAAKSFADDPAPDAPGVEAGQFESFGSMLQAVHAVGVDRGSEEQLQVLAATGANESIGSEGGFAVSGDTASELIREVHETGVLLSKTARRTASTNSNRLRIRAIDETSRADGSRIGGIQAFWEGEAAPITASQEKRSTVDLELNKLTGLYYATNELLQDSVALEQEVSEWFAEEFGFKWDDGIINGDGGGKPLGILNAAALVTVTKETSQAADTVLLQNLTKMYSRMAPRSRANAEWFINNDVLPELFNLFTAVTNVAGTENVGGIVPPNFIQFSPAGQFIIGGRPVTTIEQAATVGDLGDVIFADLSQYVTLEKGGVMAATSIHVKFVEDETAFRFTLRGDGQSRWKSAKTPFKGSNTVSPFVVVAARA